VVCGADAERPQEFAVRFGDGDIVDARLAALLDGGGQLLQIPPTTLLSRMKSLGLKR
jgi:hypothetical protein